MASFTILGVKKTSCSATHPPINGKNVELCGNVVIAGAGRREVSMEFVIRIVLMFFFIQFLAVTTLMTVALLLARPEVPTMGRFFWHQGFGTHGGRDNPLQGNIPLPAQAASSRRKASRSAACRFRSS
jgi:hypothetical protein